MADTATRRLRGILAASLSRAEIDQLLDEVLAEQSRVLSMHVTPDFGAATRAVHDSLKLGVRYIA